MNRAKWVSCCAAVALMCVSVVASGQFGGGRSAAPRAEQSPESEKSVPVQGEPLAADDVHDFCQCVGETNSPAVAKIEKALASPLRESGLDFNDTPLEEVAHQIQADYGFPVQLDTKALEEIGISADEPITVKLSGISLRSALRLLMEQHQLVYIIRDEVLMITTPESAEGQLVVCVHDVRDIVGPAKDESVDQLVDSIVSCVATNTWAENGGGEAEIRWLKPGFLVVSQTQAVHEEVRGLLATIRDIGKRPANIDGHAHHNHSHGGYSGEGGFGGGYGGEGGTSRSGYGVEGGEGRGYGGEGGIQPQPTEAE